MVSLSHTNNVCVFRGWGGGEGGPNLHTEVPNRGLSHGPDIEDRRDGNVNGGYIAPRKVNRLEDLQVVLSDAACRIEVRPCRSAQSMKRIRSKV